MGRVVGVSPTTRFITCPPSLLSPSLPLVALCHSCPKSPGSYRDTLGHGRPLAVGAMPLGRAWRAPHASLVSQAGQVLALTHPSSTGVFERARARAWQRKRRRRRRPGRVTRRHGRPTHPSPARPTWDASKPPHARQLHAQHAAHGPSTGTRLLKLRPTTAHPRIRPGNAAKHPPSVMKRKRAQGSRGFCRLSGYRRCTNTLLHDKRLSLWALPFFLRSFGDSALIDVLVRCFRAQFSSVSCLLYVVIIAHGQRKLCAMAYEAPFALSSNSAGSVWAVRGGKMESSSFGVTMVFQLLRIQRRLKCCSSGPWRHESRAFGRVGGWKRGRGRVCINYRVEEQSEGFCYEDVGRPAVQCISRMYGNGHSRKYACLGGLGNRNKRS